MRNWRVNGMYLGIITKAFGHLPLPQALEQVTRLGVRAVELGTGNYNGDQHCHPEQLLADKTALRCDILTVSGVTVTALGCHGNPLHPDPAVAGAHDAVFRSTVLLAEELGIERITLLSGCPGDSDDTKVPKWVTCGWPVDFPAVLEWQWEQRVIPYWRDCARQQAKLAWIEKTHPCLCRAYLLKEGLRLPFQLKGEEGKYALDRWLSWAARCRIPQIHRTRPENPPPPGKHPRHPRPRAQQRPRRIGEHQNPRPHPDGLRVRQPGRPHRHAMLALGGLRPALPRR